MIRVRTGAVAAVLATVGACSSSNTNDEPARVCTPGDQKSCACGGGVEGFQGCRADGTGFESCTCGTGGQSGTGGVDASVGGTGATSVGGNGGTAGSAANGGTGGLTGSFCAGLTPKPAFCADFEAVAAPPFTQLFQDGGVLVIDPTAAESGSFGMVALTESDASTQSAYGRQIITSGSKHVILEADLRVDKTGDTKPTALLRISLGASYSNAVRLVIDASGSLLEEVIDAPDASPAYAPHPLIGPLQKDVWSRVVIDLDASLPHVVVTVEGMEMLSAALDPSWTLGPTKEVWLEAGVLYAQSSGWRVSFDDVVGKLQ